MKGFPKKGTRKYLIVFILTHVGWISFDSLCNLLGVRREVTKNNLYTELRELCEAGIVEKSNGYYQITPKGAAEVTMESIQSMGQLLSQIRKLYEVRE
jgi:predicted transcriptional regulator